MAMTSVDATRLQIMLTLAMSLSVQVLSSTYPPATEDGLLDVAAAIADNFVLKASTTDFGFGSSTACGCNGTHATQRLLSHGYIGVATPDWIASPFLTTSGQKATGDSTPASVFNKTYFSNCATGIGGCGKCWQLKTTGEKNIYNTTPDKSYSANVVILDACEDRNAYGNNYQWCLAAKGVPTGGLDTNGYSGHCEDNSCGFGDLLALGKFETRGNESYWSAKDSCVVDGKWVCTNLAGQPLHFDFGIQNLDSATIEALGIWPLGTNPIVTATPIDCPAAVIEDLQGACGANAFEEPDAQLSISQCINYCPGSTLASGYKQPWIPSYWGGCENDFSCAEPWAQCGGMVWDGPDQLNYTGPTCCQWDQECIYQNMYYSGCDYAKTLI